MAQVPFDPWVKPALLRIVREIYADIKKRWDDTLEASGANAVLILLIIVDNVATEWQIYTKSVHSFDRQAVIETTPEANETLQSLDLAHKWGGIPLLVVITDPLESNERRTCIGIKSVNGMVDLTIVTN